MNTAQLSAPQIPFATSAKSALFRFDWAKLEGNHLPWAFSILLFQTTILAPLALWTMNLANGGDWQMAVLLGSSFAVLIPILSALPLRTIFRLFGLSLLLCLSVVLANVLHLMH